MKNSTAIGLILLLFSFAFSCSPKQEKELPYPSLHGQITYFTEKSELYNIFPISNDDIVLVGDDLFDRGEWVSFYGTERVKNRGIALEGTECTNYRIKAIAEKKPAKIFINTGLYDIKQGRSADSTFNAIVEVLENAHNTSPKSELYIVGILPDRRIESVEGRKDSIIAVNSYLKEYALNNTASLKYIDLIEYLSDSTGFISSDYTFNGVNLNGKGYEVFAEALSPYIGYKALNRANDREYPGKSGHYLHRISIFNSLPNTSGRVLMLGNSLNNNVRWEEFFPGRGVINRGISGDTSEGLLLRLDDVIEENPSKIFLMIGINNFINDTNQSVASVWDSYREVLERLNSSLPDTEIYVQSTLPLHPMTKFYKGRNQKVAELNTILSANSDKYGYTYIDMTGLFSDPDGNLSDKYTCDGIHLLPEAYKIWKSVILNYI